jgi:hypothetical protein
MRFLPCAYYFKNTERSEYEQASYLKWLAFWFETNLPAAKQLHNHGRFRNLNAKPPNISGTNNAYIWLNGFDN